MLDRMQVPEDVKAKLAKDDLGHQQQMLKGLMDVLRVNRENGE